MTRRICPCALPWRTVVLWSKQSQCVMDMYHEILTLNPESAEADMLAGEALDEMKDNEGSTKMFRAAVKANPKEPNVAFRARLPALDSEAISEAVSEFQAELANDPDHVQASSTWRTPNIQINQMDAARPLLERVEKQDPRIALVHLDLGIVYSDAGQNEDALRELRPPRS